METEALRYYGLQSSRGISISAGLSASYCYKYIFTSAGPVNMDSNYSLTPQHTYSIHRL